MNDDIRCPACVKLKPSKLIEKNDFVYCSNDACRYTYKSINGIPILITNSGDMLGYYSTGEKHERKNKSS